MINYFNKYGLLNAQSCSLDSEAEENTLLFSGIYLISLKRSGKPYQEFLQKYIEYVELCRVGPGLFNQTPVVPDNHDKYMSHDTLTGLICVSKEFDLSYHTEIWKTIKKQYFCYNNVDSKFMSRPLHPRDIIFYGIIADSRICKLLWSILWIIQAVACIQKYKTRNGIKIWKTDGKILAWLRCQTLGWNKSLRMYQFLNRICSGFHNWFHVFSIYYKKEHPILNLVKYFDY